MRIIYDKHMINNFVLNKNKRNFLVGLHEIRQIDSNRNPHNAVIQEMTLRQFYNHRLIFFGGDILIFVSTQIIPSQRSKNGSSQCFTTRFRSHPSQIIQFNKVVKARFLQFQVTVTVS